MEHYDPSDIKLHPYFSDQTTILFIFLTCEVFEATSVSTGLFFLDAVLLWGFQKVSGDAVVGLTWLIEFTSAGYKMVGETGPWSKVEGWPSKGFNESHGCAVERFPPLFSDSLCDNALSLCHSPPMMYQNVY